MVTNIITMEDLPRRFAIEVDRQWFDPMALDKWLRGRDVYGRPQTLPHTRQPPTRAQRDEIARKAAEWAAHQGVQYPAPAAAPGAAVAAPRGRMITSARKAPLVPPQPEPAQPHRPVYFRRHLPGRRNHAGARYRYYMVTGATTAMVSTRSGWSLVSDARPLNEQLLTRAPARVDVSLDFAPNGGGHWEQLRLEYQLPLFAPTVHQRWSSLAPPRHMFYRAIQARLPATYSHLWNGFT